jgi:hypothetical protein
MKAILTKAIPCTSTRPRRIKAYTADQKIKLSWTEAEDGAYKLWGVSCEAKVHRFAAESLCNAYGWTPKLVGGGTPEGYAWCFADSKD